MLNVLEVLHEARASLTDGEFEFTNWDTCTCGHIYAAATTVADWKHEHRAITPGAQDEPYKDVIWKVAKALGWKDSQPSWLEDGMYAPAWYVSNYSLKLATKDHYRGVQRQHAIAVIDEAIEKIEAQQQADMLAFAEQIVQEAPATQISEADLAEYRRTEAAIMATLSPEEQDRRRDGMVCT